MRTEQVTLVERKELNKAMRVQYDLDSNYNCWKVLFGEPDGYASFEIIRNISSILNEIMEDYAAKSGLKNLSLCALTLQYLADCGYDCVLIKY